MPITAAEAQKVTREFTATYPRAADLAFKFRGSIHGLYPGRAAELSPRMQGGYHPTPFVHQGRQFLGRVDVVLNNTRDAQDLRDTLRHEVIGHFGINTFSPSDKHALLGAVIASRYHQSMVPHWKNVERAYPGQPLHVQAEEVFCLRAQSVAPEHHLTQPGVAEAGQRAFHEAVRDGTRPLDVNALDRIVLMVAQGLHDRSRVQQTFPTKDASRQDLATPAPDPQRAALRSEALMIAERLARLDGPAAASPFKHPDLQAHYEQAQQRPPRDNARDSGRGR